MLESFSSVNTQCFIAAAAVISLTHAQTQRYYTPSAPLAFSDKQPSIKPKQA